MNKISIGFWKEKPFILDPNEPQDFGRVFGFVFFGVLILVLLMAFPIGTACAAAWSYKKVITIDHNKVQADLDNFPVLINLDTDSDLAAHAQDDGDDIVFTTDPASGILSHEIEYFNGTSGRLVAWVKLPTLSSSTDTQFYMHYGNPTCGNQQNPESVWDSNFKMVQHMEETSGTHYDSTSNDNDGTPQGGVTQDATGKINGADDFDGTDDYVVVADDPSLEGMSQLTIEAWVFYQGGQPGGRVVDKWERNPDGGIYQLYRCFTTENIGGYMVGIMPDIDTGTAFTKNAWQRVAMIYDGSTCKWYKNGQLIYTKTGLSGNIHTSTYPLYIGGLYGGVAGWDYLSGTIDEVRISDVARSGDWIKTCYNNQGDNTIGEGYFIKSLDSETDSSLPVELSSFTATSEGGAVTLFWRTETEVGNIGFSIYRSEEKDGNYTKISFISGAGNSAMPIDYQFTDKKAEAGKTYFYYLEDVDIAGLKSKSEIIKVVVPPAQPVLPIPKEFRLLQNYPNPFNPSTWFPYELATDATVTLHIYDVNGQLVCQLDLGKQKAGRYVDKEKAAYWDGKNQTGKAVSSGLYFYTLKAGDFQATRRMVIVK